MLQIFTITISLEVSRDKQTLSVAMSYMVIVLFVLKPTKPCHKANCGGGVFM